MNIVQNVFDSMSLTWMDSYLSYDLDNNTTITFILIRKEKKKVKQFLNKKSFKQVVPFRHLLNVRMNLFIRCSTNNNPFLTDTLEDTYEFIT